MKQLQGVDTFFKIFYVIFLFHINLNNIFTVLYQLLYFSKF